MPMIRHFVAGAVMASTMLFGAGCSSTPTSPSPTPAPATTAPIPSPTPSLAPDQQAASDAVDDYYRVLNRIATDESVPLDDFYRVAGGDFVADRLNVHFQYRGQGITQKGELAAEVRAVHGQVEPFEVDVCVDASQSDLVDKDGKSVVAPESPMLVLHRMTVRAVGDGLRVVGDEAVETPC